MSCNCHHGDHEHSTERRCCGKCSVCSCHVKKTFGITEREYEFLCSLARTPFLPLARFVMTSTKSERLQAVALEPVYLKDAGDSMEQIRETGELLVALEEKGFITLDYDRPLQGCAYETYLNSHAYQAFQKAVAEGHAHEGFLFDTSGVEFGSLTLTARGRLSSDSRESA